MPSWFPPFPVREGARLHLSLVAQMDGLLYALLGVRIEHDVFAASLSDSFCSNWGTFPGASWASSICLLYPSDFSKMDLIVATAMSHQACGLFVFPSLCSAGRLIVPAPKSGAHDRTHGGSWRAALSKNALVTFSLPAAPCMLPDGSIAPRNVDFVGVLAGFNYAGRFKTKRRPEKCLTITKMDFPTDDGSSKLPLLPFAPSRVSPMADEIFEKCGFVDDSPATPSWSLSDEVLPLESRPAPYNREAFDRLSLDYPCPVVAKLARDVVSERGVPLSFGADHTKAVVRPNSSTIAGREDEIRAHMVGEVALRRMAGPFPRPPFPSISCPLQPRTVPLKTVAKSKYDPLCPKIRLISDFSAGQLGSVNNSLWSPKLLGFHLRPSHIRDWLATAGPKAKMWAGDIPHCFRNNMSPTKLLPLFVYTRNEIPWQGVFC